MQLKTEYKNISAFVTKDESIIRELMHPAVHGNHTQSLAEATIPPGKRTIMHKHTVTEELYHITGGQGDMSLNGKNFSVDQGDTVLIPPGAAHCIKNTGKDNLTILCCCSPAYSHDDTELLE